MADILDIDVARKIKWRDSLEAWVREVIQPDVISYQQQEAMRGYDALVSARRHRFALQLGRADIPLSEEEQRLCRLFGISIQAGKGVGKNAFTVWAALHFMDCMWAPLGRQVRETDKPDIKLMWTSPTEEQLKNNLWAEFAKWIAKSPYLSDRFVHTAEKIYVREYGPAGAFVTWKTCRSSSKAEEQTSTMAGKHADFMILGVDEANAVPDATILPLESTMTGPVNFAIVTFNPTKATGYAIKTQTADADNWLTYHWDAEQSEVVDPMHIERYATKYGKDSNMYRINIRGLPPKDNADTLIPYYLVDLAIDREIEPDEQDVTVAGLDIAGGGADETVLTIGRGGIIQLIVATNKVRKREIAEWAEGYLVQYEVQAVAVDTNGLGAGVAEELEDLDFYVMRVHTGSAADDQDKYTSNRDELWCEMREAFENFAVSVPNHEVLIGELTTIKAEWHHGRNGRVKVESKKEMKARGIKSPDTADSCCLWWRATKRRGRATPRSIHQSRKTAVPVSWKVI